MDQAINLDAVYDKNLSFLIGSGASVGLLPTLKLNIKNAHGQAHTVETIASEIKDDDPRRAALFMYYYERCVLPAQKLTVENVAGNAAQEAVLDNYRKFVRTVLHILLKRKPLDKKCNIFTTNYDPCFTIVSDELLQGGTIDFVLNDGSRGFSKRYLQARNFNTYLCQTGIFERDQSGIPQLNLIHLHGSVHWRKQGAGISLDYTPLTGPGLISPDLEQRLKPFVQKLLDPEANFNELAAPDLLEGEADSFLSSYNDLPIVNPTKWKFHETVFEEHYYQMLRLLSYELEKPNSVLITFGFSFADEHILNLIKRSLANPKLQVFVCCFTRIEADGLKSDFEIYPNVRFIVREDGNLDFSAFNSHVFSLPVLQGAKPVPPAAPEAGVE